MNQPKMFNHKSIWFFYNHNMPQNASIDRINFFHKKRFHLSLVPLNKLNIYTDNSKTLEKSSTNLNTDYRIKQMNSITDFIGVNSSAYSALDTAKNQPQESNSQKTFSTLEIFKDKLLWGIPAALMN